MPFIITCHVISSSVHLAVLSFCSEQRVRLLLGELHNLILFRVAAAANISLHDCSRELTRLTRKISGSDELRRDSQNLALNSRITLVVRFRRLGDGHIRCTKTRCWKIRYQFLAYRDVLSLPNKDPFILLGRVLRARINLKSAPRRVLITNNCN